MSNIYFYTNKEKPVKIIFAKLFQQNENVQTTDMKL